MTQHHAVTPEEHARALATAMRLSYLLSGHNIPTDVHDLPGGIVVSVYAGLLAHVEEVIWWPIPDPTGTRQRRLTTFAYTPEAAAQRLARLYHELQSVPLATLLAAGQIPPVAVTLLDPEGSRHAAEPI